jgi:hypothetical protein
VKSVQDDLLKQMEWSRMRRTTFRFPARPMSLSPRLLLSVLEFLSKSKKVKGTCIQACGSVSMSPVSIDSPLGFGIHYKIIAQIKLNESSTRRPVNQKCIIICSHVTQWMCSHPGCKAVFKINKSK